MIRSFFLNEMDGLVSISLNMTEFYLYIYTFTKEQNEGILTIATSNHPEQIDDAILNRPSRFDVKYTFELPSPALRKAYIEKWTEKTNALHSIQFSPEFISEMAEKTEGFSFAFMKEL